MNDSEIETLLKELKPWIDWRAFHYTRDNNIRSELSQEGWIAAWKALQKSTGKNPKSYAMKAAEWRILNVLTRGDLTSEHKRAYGAHKIRDTATDYQYLESDDEKSAFDLAVKDLITEEQVYQDVKYHHNEIMKAVNKLTDKQKEYVLLRFWVELNSPELTEHFGYAPWGLWSKVRRDLIQELEHLKEM